MNWKKASMWIALVLIVLAVNGAVFIFSESVDTSGVLGVKAFRVASGSMNPTFLEGDHVLVSLGGYRSNPPKRGDVITYLFPEDHAKVFLHRVVGLPGEVIRSADKRIYINDVPLDESYVIYKDERTFPGADNPRDNFGPISIPEDAFFIMGDNRDQSLDSRFWGPLPANLILGKVSRIYVSIGRNDGVRWNRTWMRVE